MCSVSYTASPPSLTQPKLIAKGSTWVQIGWEPLDCDGGFKITGYDVQYKLGRYSSYSYTNAARVTSLNYTVHDLSPSTEYDFRVGPVSSVTSRYRFSRAISVTTHLSGNHYAFINSNSVKRKYCLQENVLLWCG